MRNLSRGYFGKLWETPEFSLGSVFLDMQLVGECHRQRDGTQTLWNLIEEFTQMS